MVPPLLQTGKKVEILGFSGSVSLRAIRISDMPSAAPRLCHETYLSTCLCNDTVHDSLVRWGV